MTGNFLKVIGSEILKTIKRPTRVVNVFDKGKVLPWIWSYRPEEKTNWQGMDGTEFQTRDYGTYEEYIRHQGSKLDRFMLPNQSDWLMGYDVKYREVLRQRMQPHIDRRGLAVLCLAARIGTEVKSFLDLGCFALGLDLNPGKKNKYVVFGDFHDLQYADESIDIVFTNSFDHVLEPERVIKEAKRVLKPQGRLIIELARGRKEGDSPGEYESFFWETIDDVIALFVKEDLQVVCQETIKSPFNGGKFIIFQRN